MEEKPMAPRGYPVKYLYVLYLLYYLYWLSLKLISNWNDFSPPLTCLTFGLLFSMLLHIELEINVNESLVPLNLINTHCWHGYYGIFFNDECSCFYQILHTFRYFLLCNLYSIWIPLSMFPLRDHHMDPYWLKWFV